MDDLDIATERMAKDNARILTLRKPAGPAATGRCLYCDEPTEKRWCSAECRDQFEQENQRRNMR